MTSGMSRRCLIPLWGRSGSVAGRCHGLPAPVCWARGHLGAQEGREDGCGQPQGHPQAGDSWCLTIGTELLRFFFFSVRDGH